MKRTWAAGLMLLTAACEAELSNAPFERDEAFLAAVPRRDVLSLASPAERGDGVVEQALGTETAELWRITRDLTYGLDHSIFGHLREVERIVARPPSERTDERRTWGPYREPLLGLEHRFVMTREADGHFEYAFEQRRGYTDFSPVISGTYADEAGEVRFDLDGLGGQGRVDVTYARVEGAVDLVFEIEDFADHPGEAPADATYVARREADGAGEITFGFLAADGATWEMHSRWRADGAGRSEARITAPGMAEPSLVSECWDADFDRVWARGDVETGDPAACVFPEPG